MSTQFTEVHFNEYYLLAERLEHYEYIVQTGSHFSNAIGTYSRAWHRMHSLLVSKGIIKPWSTENKECEVIFTDEYRQARSHWLFGLSVEGIEWMMRNDLQVYPSQRKLVLNYRHEEALEEYEAMLEAESWQVQYEYELDTLRRVGAM